MKYVLIITLEVCVDSSNCQIETNLQVYAVHDVKPWESRVVGRYLDVVAGWGRSLDAPLVGGNAGNAMAILLSPLDWYGFLGTLHGQRAADGRFRESVAARLRAVSTNRKMAQNCQFSCRCKNWNISAPAGSIFFKF